MDRKHIYKRIGYYIQLFGPVISIVLYKDYLLYEDDGGMAVLSVIVFFFALGGFIRHIMGRASK